MEELLHGKGIVQDLRLSYSRISDFDQKGPHTLVERSKLSGEGITIGGLVDLLLFEPDKFKSNYYIFNAKVPTASLKDLADIITSGFNEIPDRTEVFHVAKGANLWSKVVKEDTYYNKFDTPDFWSYLKAVFESKGKTIVTPEDKELAESIVEVLKNHKYSKGIVAYPNKDEDKYVQLELNFTYNQFAFKGLVDLVIVNHKDKTIQFIDLKTGSNNATQFSSSFVKYRYYLQAALYRIGASSFISEYKLHGYKVLPFKFLYIGRFEKIPLVYKVTEKWHQAAINGFTTKAGYKYRGLDDLLDDIEWHWTNKEFNLTADIINNNGEVEINDDFIEISE
jgi:hypothetical protein